jgi:hypothetical protein
MAIELTAEESGSPIPLEAGTYTVTVAKVEEAPGGQFGDQVKLYLETVDEADEDGQPFELWAFASRKLTTRSKLYRWTTAILGQPPTLGQPLRIEEALTGKPCRVQLEEVPADDGGTRKRVSAILPPSKRAANGAAPPAAPADALADFCSECAAPVSYYDKAASGAFQAFCEAHGPRGGGS